LIYRAEREIHHAVELKEEQDTAKGASRSFTAVIPQIVVLDIVFSIDSVITAAGLTDRLRVIICTVVLSFAVILLYARQVSEFILHHPARYSDAVKIQRRLADLGYYTLKVDGAFGKGSRAALKAFRQNAGLGGDSRWDLTTQKALFRGTGL
jgi:hypothetical protein